MADTTARWKIFIGPIVTFIIVLGGFIGQYATTQAEMANVKEDFVKMERKLDIAEEKVHDLELKTAVDNSVLETVKSDVAEIKADVKKLLGE